MDITKLTLYTPDNSFKNDNKYSGSITFPTSLVSGATATVTSVFTMPTAPVFTAFFAQFLELSDAIGPGSQGVQWYPANIASQGVAIHVTAPAPDAGFVNCSVYPVINGTTLTVTGYFHNPYAATITLAALTVPFVFIDYSLAN